MPRLDPFIDVMFREGGTLLLQTGQPAVSATVVLFDAVTGEERFQIQNFFAPYQSVFTFSPGASVKVGFLRISST